MNGVNIINEQVNKIDIRTDSVVKPKSIAEDSKASVFFDETVEFMVNKYNILLQKMTDYMKKKYLRSSFPNLDDEAYKKKLEGHVFDSISLALIYGMNIDYTMCVDENSTRKNIVKLLSSQVGELNDIGEGIKFSLADDDSINLSGVLRSNYLYETSEVLEKVTQKFIGFKDMSIDENVSGAKLVMANKGSEDEIVCGIIFKNSNLEYMTVREIVSKMSEEEKDEIISQLFLRLKETDYPMRELEFPYFTFDVIVDGRTYHEMRDADISTRETQKITVKHGYEIPEMIINAACDDVFREIMSRGLSAFHTLKGKWPDDAAYLVPLGFRTRVLFKMNLREIFNFVREGSSKKNSYEYKMIARQMFMQLKSHYPILAKHLKVNME